MMLRPPTLQAAPRAVLSAADGAPAQGARDALATVTSASKGYRDRLESVTTTIHKTAGQIGEEFVTRTQKIAERMRTGKDTERPQEEYKRRLLLGMKIGQQKTLW